MKTYGLVTYANYNYGSALQCFATQRLVESAGIECIHLRRHEKPPARIFYAVMSRLHTLALCIRYPQCARQIRAIWKATRRRSLVNLSRESMDAIDAFVKERIASRHYSFVTLRHMAKTDAFGAFLSGSDQIWNGSMIEGAKMHFLRFAPQEKRIAWMPSFGTKEIAPYNRRRFARYINQYRFLSVREPHGSRIIRLLTGKDAPVFLDPALLLSKREWLAYAGDAEHAARPPYLFAYFLDRPSPAALEGIERIVRLHGLEVLHFGYHYEAFEAIDGNVCADGDPMAFLLALADAAFVCTDSFHAAAFALSFGIAFYAYERQYTHGIDQSGRIEAVLTLCRVQDRFIRESADMAEDYFGYDREAAAALLDRERERCLKAVESILASGS